MTIIRLIGLSAVIFAVLIIGVLAMIVLSILGGDLALYAGIDPRLGMVGAMLLLVSVLVAVAAS
jgi:hypothetical protein